MQNAECKIKEARFTIFKILNSGFLIQQLHLQEFLFPQAHL